MIIYGRQLRGFLPTHESNLAPHPEWLLQARDRELALSKRHFEIQSRVNQHTQNLKELEVGNFVQLQNLLGNSKLRWDRSGQIVECMGFDQYRVKIDGSNRLTIRNRKHLRVIKPFIPTQDLMAELPRNSHSTPSQAVREQVREQPRLERLVAPELPRHDDPSTPPPL